MKLVLFLLPSLFLIGCSSLSSISGGKDFSKAFPDRELLGQEVNKSDATAQMYWFSTETTFGDTKADFEKFLGKGWVGRQGTQAQDKDLTKIVARGDKTLHVEGSATYLSPKYPGRMVQMMQINKFPTTKVIFIYDDKP